MRNGKKENLFDYHSFALYDKERSDIERMWDLFSWNHNFWYEGKNAVWYDLGEVDWFPIETFYSASIELKANYITSNLHLDLFLEL